LATLESRRDLSLHFNAGRSFVRGDRDLPTAASPRSGRPWHAWSFVAERYLESETHFARGGARWAAGRQWTVDLSYARSA
jgi:hypothetical protein